MSQQGRATSLWKHLFEMVDGLTENRLTRSGITKNGLDTGYLQGPLWVHGTLVMVPDGTTTGSSSLPTPMSQASTILAAYAHLGTASGHSAISVVISRIRGASTTQIAGLSLPIGAYTARQNSFSDDAGLAGDLYVASVSTGANDAADLIAWLDVRVDVIRGA